MSGLEVVGGIGAIIGIIDASIKAWDNARKDLKLNKTYETVVNRLPILRQTLETCQTNFERIANDIPAGAAQDLLDSIKSCESKADKLNTIFEETIPSEGEQWYERYRKVSRRLGKGSKVEELLKAITEDTQALVNYHAVKSASPNLAAKLEDVIKEMGSLEPSLPSEEEEEEGKKSFYSNGGEQYVHTGSGMMKVNKSSGYIGEYSGSGNPNFHFGKPPDRS